MTVPSPRFSAGNIAPAIITATLIVVAFAAAFSAIMPSSYFGDEGFHMDQIRIFLDGRFAMNPPITTLPGYHAIVAFLGTLTGHTGLNAMRAFTMLFGLLSVLMFTLILRATGARHVRERTLQFAFFPILFPFFFLVYTDVLSLFLVLVALYATVTRNYVTAALGGIVAVLMGQSDIVWLALFLVLFVAQEYGDVIVSRLRGTFRLRLDPPAKRERIATFAAIAIVTIYLAAFAAFGFFVVANGGLAIGDQGAHPFPSFHTGNVFFLLMLSVALLLPLHLDNIPGIVALWKRHWLWLLPAASALFAVYMFTYVNTHGYNQDINSVFFRNRILVFSTLNAFHKEAFFLPVLIAALSLAVTAMKRRAYVWLYPFTVVSLVPSWLIEQRYYLIPFALFLLLRKERSERFETLSAWFGVVTTALLFWPVAMLWFFL